jgi:nitrate reductase gamma subunit
MNKHYLSSLLAVFALALIAYLGTLIGLQWLFGIVLPYLAVLVFVVFGIKKVMGWARSAVPFRIPTTCGQQKTMPWIKQASIENPSSKLGVLIRMVLEIVTFRSLFRNTRMKLTSEERLSYNLEIFLWIGALAFHYAFLATIVRHTRFFLEPVPWILQLIENVDSFARVEILYDPIQFGLPGVYISGIVLLAAVIYLFCRRLFIAKVRYISLASDFFPLFLIMGIAFTGILMRYFTKVDIRAIQGTDHGAGYFSLVCAGRHRRIIFHSPVFCQCARGLFSVQQTDASGWRIFKPHPQYDSQYPGDTTCESLELSGQGAHLRSL